MDKRIGLLFDCIRAPYDIAHVMQVAAALGVCDLYSSGNSTDLSSDKVISKVKSWRIRDIPKFERFTTFEEAVGQLHSRGKQLIGTTPYAKKSLYDLDLSEGRTVFVFGNETSGLGERKQACLDDLITVPMESGVSFLTLPTVVPVIAYENYRQLIAKNGASQR